MALTQREINLLELTPQGYKSPTGKLYEKNVLGYQEIGAAPQAITPTVQPFSQPINTSVTTGQIKPNPVNYLPSGPIPTSSITPAQPLNLGTQPQVDYASPMVAGGVQFTKGLSEETKTPLQEKASAAQMRLVDLIGQTAGQAQELAAQEQAQGLEQKRQAYKDLSNQILLKNAEYKQMQDAYGMASATNEGKAITMNSIIGAEAQIDRVRRSALNSKASEIGMITAQAQAMQGNIELAQETAKRAVELKFASRFEEISILQAQLKALEPALNAEEKKQAAELSKQYSSEKEATQRKQQVENQIMDLAMKYPDARISIADSFDTALAKASRSPLYRASVQKAVNDVNENANTGVVVASDVNVPSSMKNETSLTALLGNRKIAAGTRTQIANQLGVIKAVKSLAEARQTEGFKGISPLNTILNLKVPLIGAGIPFREAAKSKEAVENAGYIEAINLKVQQWASGASLTQSQTEQVARFTPKITDTDTAIRTKLNNLYNFMNEQASSQLQSEGISFVPAKTNLFELFDLMKEASPEQLKQLKDQGLL